MYCSTYEAHDMLGNALLTCSVMPSCRCRKELAHLGNVVAHCKNLVFIL